MTMHDLSSTNHPQTSHPPDPPGILVHMLEIFHNTNAMHQILRFDWTSKFRSGPPVEGEFPI